MDVALASSLFSRLPSELIESVLEYVIVSEDELFAVRYDYWRSLILTCRYFYLIARPIRLRSLSFKTLTSLERFELALKQDSSLCELCLQFSLTTPHYIEHTDPVAVHALCPPAKRILPQLTKVRRLAIEGDFDEENAWPFYLQLFARLGKLQDLTLKWNLWCEGVFWDIFCLTFNLPHLERLTIDGNMRMPDFTIANDRVGFCRVAHLTLQNFKTTTTVLKTFLSFFGALESLEVAADPYLFSLSESVPAYIDIQEALSFQRILLRSLAFSDYFLVRIQPALSFCEFTALRMITLKFIQLPESWSAKDAATRILGPRLAAIRIDFRHYEDDKGLYDFTTRDCQWIYDFAATASASGSALKKIIIYIEPFLLQYRLFQVLDTDPLVCPAWELLEGAREAVMPLGISLFHPQPLPVPRFWDEDVEMTGM